MIQPATVGMINTVHLSTENCTDSGGPAVGVRLVVIRVTSTCEGGPARSGSRPLVFEFTPLHTRWWLCGTNDILWRHYAGGIAHLVLQCRTACNCRTEWHEGYCGVLIGVLNEI
jgi:hypothetical protein